MKIQYASDLHLEFSDNSSYLKRNPLTPVGDILILAGDVGYLNDDNYSKHPFWDWASDNYRRDDRNGFYFSKFRQQNAFTDEILITFMPQ